MKKDHKDVKSDLVPFTGVCRSVRCIDNQGFRNFMVLTLHVRDGEVIKIDEEGPHASFAVVDKMDSMNDKAFWNLNSRWKDGDTLSK